MSEQSGFWSRYVFSTDHKTIAKQYLITGLIMAVLGGWLAQGMRAQIAWPYTDVPGFGLIEPGRFNALVTMHGTIMVFWVAMPILLGAFGNFLIPLMIGARDMAFPKLNMLSYWTFFTSTVVLVASFFVDAGPAAGGWTSYPPLSADPGYTGVHLGTDLWILAVALEFASMLMGGVNYLTTTVNMRAPGMRMMDLPIVVWMQLSAAVLFMLSVGPLISGAVMLLLDRNLGSGFFDPAKGGDPLLFQHLFWFFGHPEVYVILLPGIGMVAEVMTSCARKTLFGYRMIVISVIAAGLLSFIVWAHHQFVSGLDPRLALPFALTTILISVPFAVVLFSLIATLWRASIRYTPAMLFAVSTVAMFLIGGTTGIFLGAAAADIYFHDTYFVVAHFHYTLFPATILGMLTGIYHWFPKMFGRMLNETLGKVHFWLTILFFNLTFIPQFVLGIAGHPRRVADPLQYDLLLRDMQSYNIVSTVGAIGLFSVQILFIVNFFLSMLRGRAAEANPWQATTVEWLTPSPPGHGNFAGEVVAVRGPYEYSPPGEDTDWLPQGELQPAMHSATSR
ncbi:MAG: cbb3-type cytochrome c oxidase subunit I [Candidatus Latescibacterota bacterium]|nr:MAG: cbb3-type cytochrome c oxidase subunit I [Candidatus Latescibacterota bacterium]